ncbi:hypothetical protein B0H15DRAFT_806668 [Mycena belliarum]|uniref:Uncharacterized protein n=1 Tax=Mycena belliarum TaxID=1033014 RepID=A0AAD6TQT7_9AGAR|nr:hypothetical protein B0H15DRAFT_806668 [Mycena belliae]
MSHQKRVWAGDSYDDPLTEDKHGNILPRRPVIYKGPPSSIIPRGRRARRMAAGIAASSGGSVSAPATTSRTPAIPASPEVEIVSVRTVRTVTRVRASKPAAGAVKERAQSPAGRSAIQAAAADRAAPESGSKEDLTLTTASARRFDYFLQGLGDEEPDTEDMDMVRRGIANYEVQEARRAANRRRRLERLKAAHQRILLQMAAVQDKTEPCSS